jgi:hypothetical protein
MDAQVTRPDLESDSNNEREPKKEWILQKQKEHPRGGLFSKN